MRILVTGGAGFVGSHLVDKLIKQGHKIAVIDNLSTGKKKNLNPQAKFCKIDIGDPKVSQIFRKERPKAVFHYAAQTDVRRSAKEPIEDAKVNILGSLNILENCKRFKTQKFIFASSVGVYGEPEILPVKEDHTLNPISPYSNTKLTTERYLNYYQSQGLDFVVLRYSNIYGPRQSSKGEGGVIAIFIDKILKGENPIIFGTGLQTRDFLYVNDAIDAATRALKAPPGSIYNAGTNQEITVSKLLQLIASFLQREIRPASSPSSQADIINSRIDYSKIKKELGWEPKYTLEKGLQETINWFKT